MRAASEQQKGKYLHGCSIYLTEYRLSSNVMDMIRFFVPGIPKPGGSKKAFVIRSGPRKGLPVVTEAAGQPNKDWKASVAQKAFNSVCAPFESTHSIAVAVVFYMPRPKGHFKVNGLLKSNAPNRPTTKPDIDKLMRPVLDAVKGILWHDDSQVVEMIARKYYADKTPGADVVVALVNVPYGK